MREALIGYGIEKRRKKEEEEEAANRGRWAASETPRDGSQAGASAVRIRTHHHDKDMRA